jgi:Ca-activated chloride channel homolog
MHLLNLRLSTLLGAAISLLSCTNSVSQQTPPTSPSQPSSLPSSGTLAPPGDIVLPMDSVGSVSWLQRAGNTWLLKGKNNEYYIYINLKGNDVVKEKKRIPLNISLVMDRSGSMGGDKIAYAKRAAGFVIEQLSSDDMVSVVNYDDRVEVTSASQPVKNKELLLKKINELYDRGSTNLTGGMLEGYTQAGSTKKAGYVNRVLLLTDGLANQGITEPSAIKKLVETKYTSEGIALSTFGLGADYNEDLLTQLAEVGRANYYFIDSPDKIPDIFAKELKGLLSVVAQNALVRTSFPSSLEVEKVYGFPYEIKDNAVTVRFNDIYANDQKGILIKLKSRVLVNEDVNIACQLQYTDANSFQTVKDQKSLVYKITANADAIEKSKDSLVEEMIALYESAELFDDVLNDVDKGDYERAKIKADSAVFYLKSKQQYIRSEKLKKQEESLKVYSQQIEKVKAMREEDKKIYQKSNKASNYRTKKGKS